MTLWEGNVGKPRLLLSELEWKGLTNLEFEAYQERLIPHYCARLWWIHSSSDKMGHQLPT